LTRLGVLSFDAYDLQDLYFHKDLAYAGVFYALKDFSAMKSHADLARASLEKTVSEHPDDPRYHSALGQAYAYLGRKEEAIREGNQAVSICPVSKDAMAGPTYVDDLARMYVVVGEYDSAIDKLDYLMSIPAGSVVSLASLEKDPIWDPLRDQPRFKQLIEKYLKPS
jgi:serine/threonine-protein kinase